MEREMAQEARTEERWALKQDRAPAEAPEAATRPKRRAGEGTKTPEHVVFLVPGLLGFDNFATFGYFADRVTAALRSGLEQLRRQPVPVVAVPIPPTASLRDRQRKLVTTLADRLHALEHAHQPLQVHLVGHSTGGVDADLLTHEEPVGGGPWAELDPRAQALRERIRSVVSIGSPHQGACITRDPLGRLIGQGDLRGVPALTQLLGKFLVAAMSDVEVPDIVFSAKRELGKSARFVSNVLSSWPLVSDLQPLRTPGDAARKKDVVRRSFVTIAGRPTPGAGSPSAADFFFHDVSARASGFRTGCAEEGELVQASVARLRQALDPAREADYVIKARGVELPVDLDAGHNDGIVNSARQLMNPRDPHELAGIVVGDHFDVVGYYDRRVWVADRHGHDHLTHVVSGLLHSGSNFRDEQFFELYRRVSEVIAEAAR